MQGAGVYLLGLWGVMSGRDRKVKTNLLAKVDPFTYKGYAPPIPTGETLVKLTYKQIERRYGPSGIAVLDAYIFNKEAKRQQERLKDSLRTAFGFPILKAAQGIREHLASVLKAHQDVVKAITHHTQPHRGKAQEILSEVKSILKNAEESLSSTFKALESSNNSVGFFRRAWAKEVRKLLRQVSRSLSCNVKKHVSPARIPRPIHTRPRPPAAPLAPPIFA